MDVSTVEILNVLDHSEITYDSSLGEALDSGLVKAASEKHGVCEKVPLEECWRVAGKGPIGVKWADVNEGGTKHPAYRSR